MPRVLATRPGFRLLAAALVLCGVLLVVRAQAAGAGPLQSKLATAREEASGIAADLRAKQEQLATAQQEADAAAAREERLSGLLESGEQRAAELTAEVRASRARLREERQRLRRARRVLAERLVAIYESGSPGLAGIVLTSADYDELLTQSEYVDRVEEYDSLLAARVAQVRNAVDRGLERVSEEKARVDAYNERLAEARSQIVAVHQAAVASASQLQAVTADRQATLAGLKSDIDGWVEEIQAARAAAAEEASRSAAEAEVERWLGGPYAIPTYIVMCESGGNYGAVNPSSGAGGAYQILPSTWQLYGGKGDPEDASKAEQDAIATQIWADSGTGAWVCG